MLVCQFVILLKMQSSLGIFYFDLEVNPTSKGILEYGAIFHGKIFWNTTAKKIRYKESIKKWVTLD